MNLDETIAAIKAAIEDDELAQDQRLHNLENAVYAINLAQVSINAELERIRKHLRDAGTRGTL